MTLEQLSPGEKAVIVRITCDDFLLRRHILEMGLTSNTTVTMVKAAPLGDPLEIRARGYALALRRADAARIELLEGNAARELRRAEPVHVSASQHAAVKKDSTRKPIPAGQGLRLALAGNQNCGKTTLFNRLTGANQRVGNFPGVTVERKDGAIRLHPEAVITDLPGIYSLSPYSSEETVTMEFLLRERPDAIINIVDATNLERNLYLSIQLIELGMPMVLALNMMDEVRESGGAIDADLLEAALGVPVVPISAAKGEGMDELIGQAVRVARFGVRPRRENPFGEQGAVQECVCTVMKQIDARARQRGIPACFAAAKLIEGDAKLMDQLGLTQGEADALERAVRQMEAQSGQDRISALVDMRFRFITELCAEAVTRPDEGRALARSQRIDRILTGRFTAIPAFIAIMALVFYLTFGQIGILLSDLLSLALDALTRLTDAALVSWGVAPAVRSLVIDGIFTGVGSVLDFLPVIAVLFFLLSLLEDSGYMARVAFVTDQLLRRIGLSGRSVVPMLIGLGCSVPAIMATRTLPTDRDRRMTILLTPFINCSAKLPIYALFSAAFFPSQAALVMAGLYFGGIALGILYALLIKRLAFQGEPAPFVMELSNYRMPALRSVMRLVGQRARDFITRAFTLILLASIAVWFLQTFDGGLGLVSDASQSLLARLGGLIAPLFRPLGLGDWRISTALITGFTAKESVVSTFQVLLSGSEATLETLFTPATALVFLSFTLLYTPCVAALAAVRRELGGRWAALMALLQCGVAWVLSFLAATLFRLLGAMA